MLSKDQIAGIRSLIRQAFSYSRILKWDESRVRRNKEKGHEGEFAKMGGPASMYGTRILPGEDTIREMPPGVNRVKARGRAAGRAGRADRERAQEKEAGFLEDIRRGNRPAADSTVYDVQNRLQDEAKKFRNPPQAKNFQPPPPEKPATTEALVSGNVKRVIKKMSGNANASYKVEMEDGTEAIYKPEVGETWTGSFSNSDITDCITNRDFSLAEREAMASEVSIGLGLGNFVPETHLRETLDVPGVDQAVSDEDDDNAVIWDTYELREMYDEHREKQQEKAYEEVADEMGNLYGDAQQEHVEDIKKRAEEVQEIWDELIQEYPKPEAMSESMARAHPTLPMGSQQAFERRAEQEPVDLLEVMDEADVDVSAGLSNHEKERLTEVLRKKLDEGYRELGEVDEDKARDHLEYDKFIEAHADTEQRLMESKIQSFDSWRAENGYDNQSGGGGGPKNSQAPHPGGGSLQKWVLMADRDGDMSHEDATKYAVLDYVLGSMDRHGNNVVFHGDTPYAIDNGYSMPEPEMNRGTVEPDNFTFRSVGVREWMSDARHHEVPESVRQPILDAINRTDWEAMADRHPNMSSGERKAFLGRIERMKEALSYAEGLATLWHDMRLMY